jgi:class 3 adenylate cyclase
MPYYMDRHDLKGATAADLAAAHLADVGAQDRFGVEYLNYWFDYDNQKAFCLARGPNSEAVDAVHRAAHGNVATKIIEIEDGAAQRYLGRIVQHDLGEAYVESAFRAILFTDIAGSTAFHQKLGDAEARVLVRRHDTVVRAAIAAAGGSEVKHTGDGIMASFPSVAAAIDAAIDIQRRLAKPNEGETIALSVRIGIAAGEPVAESDDLFGAAVNLAARLCSRAEPASILVPSAIRDLTLGKRFSYTQRGRVRLKGFDEPVRVFEVDWRAAG